MREVGWHRVGIVRPVRIWLTVVMVAIPAYVSAKDEDIYALGVGVSSCGEFLRGADDERKRRSPNAGSTAIYDIKFGSFVSYADGFLTGTNYSDPIEGNVGKNTDLASRMAWLENYCRNHPLDQYINAVIELRKYLLH